VLATETAIPRITPLCQLHPAAMATAVQQSVAAALCPRAPGSAIERTATEILQAEVQPHSKHQKDYADLRELPGDLRISHKSGSVWPDRHARQEIADDRESPTRFARMPKSSAALSPSAIVVMREISCMSFVQTSSPAEGTNLHGRQSISGCIAQTRAESRFGTANFRNLNRP
jgi:hypothetical protein